QPANQRRELRLRLRGFEAHVVELTLRHRISQPLDLEQCHGKVRRTRRQRTIPDSDLRDLVQPALRARRANLDVLDRQPAQAAPEDAMRAMVPHDGLHETGVARVAREESLQHSGFVTLPQLVDLDEGLRLVAEPPVESLRSKPRAPGDPIRVGAQESTLVELARCRPNQFLTRARPGVPRGLRARCHTEFQARAASARGAGNRATNRRKPSAKASGCSRNGACPARNVVSVAFFRRRIAGRQYDRGTVRSFVAHATQMGTTSAAATSRMSALAAPKLAHASRNSRAR